MSTAPLLSVILPAHNESGALESLLPELTDVLDTLLPGLWELWVVDDGSTDETAAAVERLRNDSPAIHLLRHPARQGQSPALWSGFKASTGEWIATLDADGQNDPADLPALWEKKDEADAVFGYRGHRRDPRRKILASRLANRIRNTVLSEDIVDTGCSLKLFRRSLLKRLHYWNGMHRFYGSLFLMQGARIIQIPVRHRPRVTGVSHYTNLSRLPLTLRQLFMVRRMKKTFTP